MKEFNELLELENSFNKKNDIILSFYKEHINSDDDSNLVNSIKTSFKHYLSFTDNIKSRLSLASDLVQTMSLLIEREEFLNYVLISNNLNK